MKISVALCTWNRAEMLRTTLQSLTRLQPGGTWELVLVDNNSTDHTTDVIESFRDRLPLVVVTESQQGHSFSRNRALVEAAGEFVIWTDDDVEVGKNWLAAYRDAFAAHPQASFFGGPIEPRYLGPVPNWLRENQEICDGVYARRQLGNEPISLDADSLPYGANFATRRSVQQQFPFRSHFGRVASGVRGYDEIDVLMRMLKAGHCGFWVPDASLQHLIPDSRMTCQYVRDYFFGQGQTWIARGVRKPTPAELQNQIRHHKIGYWLGRLTRHSPRWFSHLVQLSNLQGQLDQLQRTGTDPAADISVNTV